MGETRVLCGFGDGELEPHGLRARLTSRPDMTRALDGWATGSGGFVSGIVKGGASWDSELGESLSSSSSSFSAFWSNPATRVTAIAGSLLCERSEVRRKMSLPAATSSLVGEGVWLGEAKSEKVLRNGGETGPKSTVSGRF